MDEFELRNILSDYIKEICHYSQMQVFATSSYQKNYFQLHIDEKINELINFIQADRNNAYFGQRSFEALLKPEEINQTPEEEGPPYLFYPSEGSEIQYRPYVQDYMNLPDASKSNENVMPELPEGTAAPGNTAEPGNTGATEGANELREITPQELAENDGSGGKAAYVAINGNVYDVSNIIRWAGGMHFGLRAGNDLTQEFNTCHNGMLERIKNLPIVGVLKQ